MAGDTMLRTTAMVRPDGYPRTPSMVRPDGYPRAPSTTSVYTAKQIFILSPQIVDSGHPDFRGRSAHGLPGVLAF